MYSSPGSEVNLDARNYNNIHFKLTTTQFRSELCTLFSVEVRFVRRYYQCCQRDPRSEFGEVALLAVLLGNTHDAAVSAIMRTEVHAAPVEVCNQLRPLSASLICCELNF